MGSPNLFRNIRSVPPSNGYRFIPCMKHLRLFLIFSAFALSQLHAQRDEEPIPDFTNLDEFIYEPKTTLTLGFRSIGGAKASFQGTGKISETTESIGGVDESNIQRTYHDGS